MMFELDSESLTTALTGLQPTWRSAAGEKEKYLSRDSKGIPPDEPLCTLKAADDFTILLLTF